MDPAGRVLTENSEETGGIVPRNCNCNAQKVGRPNRFRITSEQVGQQVIPVFVTGRKRRMQGLHSEQRDNSVKIGPCDLRKGGWAQLPESRRIAGRKRPMRKNKRSDRRGHGQNAVESTVKRRRK